MQKRTEGNMIPSSESKVQSVQLSEAETSTSLSKDLALRLLSLIDKVNASDVNPSTVNAACNCASEIHKILKLNYEMKRNGF